MHSQGGHMLSIIAKGPLAKIISCVEGSNAKIHLQFSYRVPLEA